MDIKDLIEADAVIELREPDKWRVIREMARQAAARLDLDPAALEKALVKRETLGSTGLGNGIALPHARIANVHRPLGLFAHLKTPLPFDAIDDLPVDLIFMLLLPENQPDSQLKSLACVARRLRDPVLAGQLRNARGALSLYELLTGP